MPLPAVNVVTTISSKLTARMRAARRRRARADQRKRHQPERLERVGAEVGRCLVEVGRQAAQPGEDVVVDDDDAERRVGDDQREQAERDTRLVEASIQRDAGHDAGQRDRQHDQERDRAASEELEAVHGEASPSCRAQARPR